MSSEQLKVVVTGASGFLGRAVVARLLAEGHECLAVTRGDETLAGATMLRVADYTGFAAPPDAVLIHLAETRAISAADSAGDAHLDAATELVRSLLLQGWAHVIYVSSAAVYGDRTAAPHHPDERPEPASIYGRSKLACEALVLAQGGTVLRATNLIGPGMAADNVLADILRQLDRSEPLALRALSPVRDYLWVDDAATLLVRAAELQKGGVFNAASGRDVSVRELALLALVAAGQDCRPLMETRPVGDNSTIKLDIASTIWAFDWTPRTSLEDALKILVQTD